ncbi:ribose-5-phosphate isomerase RpiA [Xylocopilactobacillus apis]|uniref:Ribose-5-phosphate isomerase A n=1 Tax=Xylocopilactobacillus apis TaxID=2932183 RepID=A0AAU9CTL2_9LACO|nr:ribose-5-phosphate isomerase RpiA [Xylocopilactobacillus apis]BDR57307.1 ribose-5-phosphate isomerase A [Xylocopilactobacillus apis]
MEKNLINQKKKNAGIKGASLVEDKMMIGLGTGSTVFYLVEALAKRVKEENLNITAVATSSRTASLAEELGIKIKQLDEVDHLDLTIDGADEIDANFQGIKGGGAAHTLEKIVATASNRNVWIVDESKMVNELGAFPLPLEVVPYGSSKVYERLDSEGLNPKFRLDSKNQKVLTHYHNYIIDLHLGVIKHPHLLAQWLDHQVGILEHGLFLDTVNTVIVGKSDKAEVIPVIRK